MVEQVAGLNGQVEKLLGRFPESEGHIHWLGNGWVTEESRLTPSLLRHHLTGTDIRGLYPHANEVATVGVIDIDLHPPAVLKVGGPPVRAITPETIAENEAYALK